LLSGSLDVSDDFVERMNTEAGATEVASMMLNGKTEKEKNELLSAYTGIDTKDIEKLSTQAKQDFLSQFLNLKAQQAKVNQLYATQDFISASVKSGAFAGTWGMNDPSDPDEGGVYTNLHSEDFEKLKALTETLTYEQQERTTALINSLNENLNKAAGKTLVENMVGLS
jgi:hypothetical protein